MEKKSPVIAGAILISIGVLFLLRNYNLLNIDLTDIWKFWPTLLIYSGLVLLIGNKNKSMIYLLMAVLTGIIILLYLFTKDSVDPSLNVM